MEIKVIYTALAFLFGYSMLSFFLERSMLKNGFWSMTNLKLVLYFNVVFAGLFYYLRYYL
jgi:hypothetical protein